jgi:signal transduction histidine kinase
MKIAKEKAEESNRLKTAFLANLSHEIRTPMNGTIGFSELALLPDVTSEERREYSSIIAKNCKQLLALVNDIIDISKIESGIVEINRKPFNQSLLYINQSYLSGRFH